MEDNKENTVNYIYVQNEDEKLKKRVRSLEILVGLATFVTGYGFYMISKYLGKNNSSKEDTTKGE